MALSEWERGLLGQVSVDRLMETTRSIARWVRLSGSDAELESVHYVRGLLDGYGLETDIIEHDAYISLPGRAEIVLPDGTSIPCISHSFGASTGENGLTAQVVDTAAAGLAGAAGKIALVDGLAMPPLVRDAEAAGAVAQIYINGSLTHEMIVSPVWGSPDIARLRALPHTPVLSVTADGGEAIRAFLARGGGAVRIRAEVETRWRTTPILTASLTVPGREDFVLFSGHIDSWHYGAMDNGSANAAMIEVACVMAGARERMRRGLRLAFWSGHSHGRYSGSAWYADNHWTDLHEHCVAHVNADSLGGRGATVLSEAIATASTRALGAEVMKEVAGVDFRGGRVGRSGDQSFMGIGVPSLWMTLSEQPMSDDPTAAAFGRLVGGGRTGGLGWWWHTTEDTPDKIDPDLLLRDTRIYLAGLARLLCAPLLPLSAAAEARELHHLLEQRQEDCGGAFDLSALIAQAATIVQGAEALDRWAEQHSGAAKEHLALLFNDTVRAICRCLLPVNYTAAGPFDHDPALTMPPVPLLAGIETLRELPQNSDEARFLTVRLVRARNQIQHALVRAEDAVRRAGELTADADSSAKRRAGL
jgi:hypothetical protein